MAGTLNIPLSMARLWLAIWLPVLVFVGCSQPPNEESSMIVAGLDVQEPELLAYLQTRQQSVRAASRSAAARGQLGLAYAANGFHAAAEGTFAQAAALDPQDMRWLYYQAISLSELVRTHRALEILARAIAVDVLPRNPPS